MSKRRRMKDRYRRVSFLSDIEGMKGAIGEMRGMFFPKQPLLKTDSPSPPAYQLPDEEWFIRTLSEKILNHPENAMEYPFFDEPIFDQPLVGFVRGNDPIFIYGCGLCATGVPCESGIPKPLQ